MHVAASRDGDVLTDLLERSRARGAAFSHSTARGDWGLSFGAVAGLAVHVIVEGEAVLLTGDGDPMRLLAGDIVLLRGAVEHHLASAAGATCIPLGQLLETGPIAGSARRFSLGSAADGAPDAVFCCGAYMFEGDLCDGLIEALPDVVRLRPAAGSTLRATADLLAREMLGDAAGQQTLLDRLLDVALIHVLREHFASRGAQAPGWFRAGADPQIGAALRALHADPARVWTVADLAAQAALSRAAFARRFGALLGVAPLTYLTDWRMALAREHLRDGEEPLAAIAAAVGYASEFSFAAAFKRHSGVAPGRWRAAARGSVAA